ncbi:hypothetical protein R1sor_006025 [Riccia sorocarpa]|uniref:Uncharacterized protein n=1 Tax=Riccia sorocarpa TaxID=122646 RepID=A0ABD3HSR1_9MARC
MKHIFYLLKRLWPKLLTLRELQAKNRCPRPFNDGEVMRAKRKAGVIPEDWTTDRKDYYVKGVEFVQVEYLEYGVVNFWASSVSVQPTFRAIKADITKAVGWDSDLPAGGVICVKSLTNKGLHTFVGMISY